MDIILFSCVYGVRMELQYFSIISFILYLLIQKLLHLHLLFKFYLKNSNNIYKSKFYYIIIPIKETVLYQIIWPSQFDYLLK